MEQCNIKRQNKRACRINERYVYADFSNFSPITEEVRASNASKIFTGGVRINNSMYRTQAETDEYIKQSLKRKLP